MGTWITILSAAAGTPVTKTLYADPDGMIRKLPAKIPALFSVTREHVETIDELAALLTCVSADPHKLVIRGEPIPGIDISRPVRRLKYSRNGVPATFRSSLQGEQWLCFDFDKVPCPAGLNPATDPGAAMTVLSYILPPEFHDVTFWAQWSSSAGLNGWATLSAHLWFMMDRNVTDDDLNFWALTRCPIIDARLFNAVQPHFTAAPIMSGGVTDPVSQRHGLVRGSRDLVNFTFYRKLERRAA